MPATIRPVERRPARSDRTYGHLEAENAALNIRTAQEILQQFKRFEGSEVFVGRVGGAMGSGAVTGVKAAIIAHTRDLA